MDSTFKSAILRYADKYSHDVWSHLMSRFKKDDKFSIGANDVSDIVLNAILDTLDGMKDFGNEDDLTII